MSKQHAGDVFRVIKVSSHTTMSALLSSGSSPCCPCPPHLSCPHPPVSCTLNQVIASRRVLLSSSTSLTSRARRSLARHSFFRTMMSLGGDPGSGDSDSNGDGGGLGIDDDPLASFSLSALGALGALGRTGGRGGGDGGGGRGERSILNDFLGQFIQSGNATTVRQPRVQWCSVKAQITSAHASF